MEEQSTVDTDEDGLYDFTEDQIQAMLELDLLQREAVECPDDIQARLEEVNRALAEDPTPTESDRNIRVAFKSEVVDLLVPPEDATSGEEYVFEAYDALGSTSKETFEDENSDEETVKLSFEECERLSNGMRWEKAVTKDEGNNESAISSTAGSLVDKTTINFSLENDAVQLRKDKAVQSGDNDLRNGLHRPKQMQLGLSNKGDEEVSSSTLVSVSDLSNSRRKRSVKEKQENERMRKEAADLAFQSWLRHKRKTAREQRRREKREREEKNRITMPQVDTSATVKDYWRRKRRETREKQKETNKQAEEIKRQEQLRLRNRQDVEMAYQRWLDKKEEEARIARHEEHRRQLIIKLSLRNSRRSQALALALNTARPFVDYHGYR